MITHDKWKWFGTPGHFICARDCRFHLCTQVGKYLISTVGELWSQLDVRRIHADVYDSDWVEKNRHLKGDAWDDAYMIRFGYQEVGCGRLYETMTFIAGKKCKVLDCNCGLPEIGEQVEGGFNAANERGPAAKGHHAMCLKYAKEQ